MDLVSMQTKRGTLRQPPEKPMTLRWKREIRAAIGENHAGRLIGLGAFIRRFNEALAADGYLPMTDPSTFNKALKLDGFTRASAIVTHASRILGVAEPTEEEVFAEDRSGPQVTARGTKIDDNPLIQLRESDLRAMMEEVAVKASEKTAENVATSVEEIVKHYLEGK